MSIYFDTNVFIYLSNQQLSFYKEIKKLIKYCQDNKIQIVTSVETIQEIVHYAQNIKQLSFGLQTSQKILALTDKLCILDKDIINLYLAYVKKYKNRESRDFIHLATCHYEKIDMFITCDKGFKKFKEIKSVTPDEFLRTFTS